MFFLVLGAIETLPLEGASVLPTVAQDGSPFESLGSTIDVEATLGTGEATDVLEVTEGELLGLIVIGRTTGCAGGCDGA